MMSTTTSLPNSRHAGFTLVEIMVGLAIGLLATLVIIQVISVFEAQKRVTTGAADSQTNGSVALFNIVREMNLAGYPLMAGISAADPKTLESPLECTTVTYGATGITSISPVGIVDGVSDTITIRYGNSFGGGITNKVGSSVFTWSSVPVTNTLGCDNVNGDTALFVNGTTCALTGIPASGVIDATTIALEDNSAITAGAAISGANFSCLGQWSEVVFAVNNGNLERNGTPIVADIVNLQAQYGLSTSVNSNQISLWVEPSDININNITDRNRIKAIRIAIVARNAKQEAGNVTTALSAWTGSASSPAPTIDLSADADWQRYRYRVFETIVPLRNVIWSKDSML
jgi:type IV pilus assembly protein PilW